MSQASTALRRSVGAHLVPAEAAALSFLGATIFLWAVQCGPVPKLSLALWILEALISLVVWGRVALLVGGYAQGKPRSLILELLTGTVIVSGLLTAGRLLADLTLLRLWWAQLLVGLGIYVWCAPRIAHWRSPAPAARREALALALCCLGASAWTRFYRPGWGPLGDGQVVFRFINDYCLHSQIVWMLASEASAAEIGRAGLAGQPIPLYHYAGYALSACMSAHTGLPALNGMFSFWLPFGFLLVGLAAGALAREWFGTRGAIPAAILLLVLPDPTLLPMLLGGQPDFAYYSLLRFLVYTPSNAYGIAAAALALVWLCSGMRRRKIKLVVGGALLGATAVFFKAQPFLTAAMLAMALLVIFLAGLAFQARARLTLRTVGLVTGLAGFAALVAYLWGPVFLERAPPVVLARPPGRELAEFLFSRVHAEPIAGWLVHQAVSRSGAAGLLSRCLLVLYLPLRLLGGGVVLLAMGVELCQGWRAIYPFWKRAAGLIALAVYLGFAILLAPHHHGLPWGNPWDYQLVTFAWTQFAVLSWSAGRLAQWPPLRRYLVPECVFLVALLLLVPSFWLGGIPLDDNGMTAGRWAGMTLPEGLVDCAQYLRQHTHPAERFQDSENDSHLVLEPISERRLFVGWPVVTSYTAKDRIHPLFLERLAEHERFQQTETAVGVEAFLSTSGVRWYLLSPESRVAWRRHAVGCVVFSSQGFQIIDLWQLARHLAEDR